MTAKLAAIAAILAALIATPVMADPCKAIPDRGPMPAYLSPGSTFAGPVVYVGDGDSICVSVGPRQGLDWVEVRVADFYAPELHAPGGSQARDTMEDIAMGRHVSCIAQHRSYDRVVATCRLGGVSLGDLMRKRGVAEGGNGR